MNRHAIDDDIDDLPPSAKYVLDVVERKGPIRRQELLNETDLPERTVDRALDRLHTGDYIVKTRESGDLRQILAKLASE